MRRALLGVLAIALAACRRDTLAIKPNDGDGSRTEGDAAEPPRVRVLADIVAHDGERVVVEATYEVEPVAYRKGARLVWLVLVDGTRVARGYEVVPGELPFANRRVLARGIITSGPPDPLAQSLSAPHFALERLALPDGEPPLETDVVALPAPPMASSTPALGGRIDRWVQVVGTVATITKEGAAILKLSDGGSVRVQYAPTAPTLLGKLATVTGRLAIEQGTGGAFALDLVIAGNAALCAGVVSRCGM